MCCVARTVHICRDILYINRVKMPRLYLPDTGMYHHDAIQYYITNSTGHGLTNFDVNFTISWKEMIQKTTAQKMGCFATIFGVCGT